jgi:3-methyladenine DNA glycosylase AlkD
MKDLVKEITHELRSVADPARRQVKDTMFPTSMEYIGVRAPNMRTLTKQWLAAWKSQAPEKWIELAKELIVTRIFECNMVAFEFLEKNKKALSMLTNTDLQFLGQNMDNWATTDAFSVLVAGSTWRNGQITDGDVLCWLNSGNRWWRRAAIVSTVGLNLRSRGGTGETARTLFLCEKVIDDRDDMMVKALSWALRELSKSDKLAVENFLEQFHQRLAGRVFREVTHKLVTGKKN